MKRFWINSLLYAIKIQKTFGTLNLICKFASRSTTQKLYKIRMNKLLRSLAILLCACTSLYTFAQHEVKFGYCNDELTCTEIGWQF